MDKSIPLENYQIHRENNGKIISISKNKCYFTCFYIEGPVGNIDHYVILENKTGRNKKSIDIAHNLTEAKDKIERIIGDIILDISL